LASPFAHAQTADAETSPWAFTIGAKAWAHEWSTWEISRVQKDGTSLQALGVMSSGTTPAYTPLASLRYRRMFVAASYMTPTDYTLTGMLVERHGTRSELDANIGYDILRGVAVSAGYKRLMQSISGEEFTWRGPTIAATLSAPLEGAWGVYGTAGYGRMKAKLPRADAAGNPSRNADYTLLELGLAYSVPRSVLGPLRALTFTGGYRSQTVRTRKYGVSSQLITGGPVTITHVDPRDYTQGWTLSLIGTF
jgi:hypothetical protein